MTPTATNSTSPVPLVPAPAPSGETKQESLKQDNAAVFRFPKPPQYDSLEEERSARRARLAAAYRVFADQNLSEGIAGHLTYRDPILTDHFWVAPFGIAFDEVCASDLLLIAPDGSVTMGGGSNASLKGHEKLYNRAAFAIHHALHTARPDIDAACHSHSFYGKAFSTLGRNIDITTQDSCLFHNDISHYANFGGVVLAEEEGGNIARALGDKNHSIILQNHGILTAGSTIEGAVFRFIALEKHCQVMLTAEPAAIAHGGPGAKPVQIDEEDATYTHKQIAGENLVYFQAKPYFQRVTRGNTDYMN